ncbi:MAG: UbiD family decarboxylase [Deltaproteobacteria bacterium]|nr:UbiD family decarboxylase [Deltaproteobacteria bacterium]
MPFRDMRGFLAVLEDRGELLRISDQIDPRFEVGAINRMLVEQRGPAALFENIRNSPAPVATFLFGTQKRVNIAFGTDCQEQTVQKYLAALESDWPEPLLVQHAPCKENVIKAPDLTRDIPNIIWGELDGGSYITLPLIVSKDRKREKRNMGIYRVMIRDAKEAGILIVPTQHIGMMYAEYERHDEPMEVAIAVGGDPLLYVLGAAPLKYGDDELSLLGAIRGEPVELVKCETVDLEVPASAEVIIEGEVLPKTRKPEGPFGEYTGYYGTRGERPVLKINCITHRNDYIWTGAYLTKPFPPNEDTTVRSVSVDAGILSQARKVMPEIKNFHMMESSGVSYFGVVQIGKKPYPFFARQVMDAIWATHKGCWIKFLVVVDEDIDIYSIDDVVWAMATRVQPHSDTYVIDQHIGFPLDPSAGRPGVSSHMGIDATVKIPERFDSYPPLAVPSEGLMATIRKLYGETGFYKRIMKDHA